MSFGRKIIYGCESRGDAESPYLTRYTLFACTAFQLCLHIFHRSDADELHDHPWPFVSLILWRGYIEEIASQFAANRDRGDAVWGMVEWERRSDLTRKHRVWPGMVLFRRAAHAHRVHLIDGKSAVTLVLVGKPQRNCGFFTKRGWENFKSYFARMGC